MEVVLTNKQKDLLLFKETEEKFGYKIEDLSYGSVRWIVHKCEICGETKETTYRMFVKNKDLAHYGCRFVKIKQTNLQKYNSHSPFGSKEVREKSKQTFLSKYGETNASQVPKIRAKQKKTIQERYGVDNPSQLEEVKQKKRRQNLQTWLKKHEIESSLEDVFEKATLYVKHEVQKEGYDLLSKYIDCKAKLEIRCPEGHEYSVSWNSWDSSKYRCPQCQEYKHQKLLGSILEKIYPNNVILHDRYPEFLDGLQLDFYIPELNIGFEYDGQQHHRPVRFGGISEERAKENFKALKGRDRKKNRLCKSKGCMLIRVKYDEDLTLEHIRQKIQSRCHNV